MSEGAIPAAYLGHINSKAANHLAILDLIRWNGPLSRTDLAQPTGLSIPTVSNIVESLRAEQLVQDLGQGDSRGGRRPQLFGFNPHVRYVVALSLAKTKLTIGLLDLDGNILTRREHATEAMNTPSEGMQQIIETVDGLMASEAVAEKEAAYIGLSVPGVVDPDDGRLVVSNPLQWYDVPLGQRLAERFDLPILVENDGIAAAWAERRIGADQGRNHMVVFLFQETGMGSGVIINGQVYRGASGVAGEIGHMVVDGNGPRCTCGNYGCLLVMVAQSALVAQGRQAIEDGVDTIMARIVDGDVGALTLDTIIEALAQGDRVAFTLVDRIGRYLGNAVAKVVHILNPSKVIIAGSFVPFGDTLLGPVRRAAKAAVLSRVSDAPDISMSQLGGDVALRGVALLCSERWLSSLEFASN
ncbi:MAG: ROK family transcriptional regulator [Anaerolineae bacterium]|jgi:glucokinase-like ROK family protein